MEEGHPGGLPWSGSVLMAGTDYVIQRGERHDLSENHHVQGLSGKAIAFISPSDIVVPIELPVALVPTVPLAATPLGKEGLQLLITGGAPGSRW